MRWTPRGDQPAPSALTELKAGQTELERARDFYEDATKTGSYDFKVYKASEVKVRLDELFHGKCAYCETFYASSAPVDIEHYRPKAAVEGAPDHRGYWWLAMAWENLLPSCIDCNRRRKQSTPKPGVSLEALSRDGRFNSARTILTGKRDLFPLADAGVRAESEGASLVAEQALLLNPCDEDPGEHLVHHVERVPLVSLVLPRAEANAALPAAQPALGDVAAAATADGLSVRGAVSIQVYGLNRLGLVQDRTRILRHLEFLEVLIIELSELIDTLESKDDPDVVAAVRKLESLKQRTLAEMTAMADDRAPYTTMVRAWIKAFQARLG